MQLLFLYLYILSDINNDDQVRTSCYFLVQQFINNAQLKLTSRKVKKRSWLYSPMIWSKLI